MSETQTEVIARPPAEVKYVLYDPDPRRRRRRRARRYDPAPRRRKSSATTGSSSQVALVDAAVDGIAWGYISRKIPLPSQQIGPFVATDAVAIGGAVAYEKFYMKRRWTHALIAAGVAYLVGRWTA